MTVPADNTETPLEVAIKEAVPSIEEVLDSTDHAGGDNPYYQPGKGGTGAM